MTEPDPSTIREQRDARAKQFFESDLGGQQAWYDSKATWNKRFFRWLSTIVLAAGASTAMVQVFVGTDPEGPVHLTTVLTVALGATVVIAKGLESLCSPEDAWKTYRQASEKMKRERRLYTNQAGVYAGITDEENAFRTFVERIESVLGEEQNIYWKGGQENPSATGSEELDPSRSSGPS